MPSTVPSASYLDSFHTTDNADLRTFAREVRTTHYPQSTCDGVPVAPAKLVYAYPDDGDVAYRYPSSATRIARDP